MSGMRVRGRQYPGEKEITFPPFTCLEADGDARLERDAKDRETSDVPAVDRESERRRLAEEVRLGGGKGNAGAARRVRCVLATNASWFPINMVPSHL